MIESQLYQIGVAVAAVAALLLCIIRYRMQPFIALLIISMLTALATGMPPQTVMESIQKGMGGTLGFIAVVVGLGAMFGRMLEISGGAERLTLTLLRIFGRERAAWAMTVAGFFVAIPVFFDVGFIILIPLVYSLANETKRSLLYYGIPLLAGLAVTHAFVPPTPGPIAVANLVGADLGSVILYGTIVGIPCAILSGPLFGGWIARRIHVTVPDYMEKSNDVERLGDEELPGFGLVFCIILLPLLLIVLNTFSSAFIDTDGTLHALLAFIGHPFFALSAATLLAFTLLGTCRGISRDQINEVATSALAPAGIIILVTGAGGVFKQVLIDSGTGETLANGLTIIGLHPIWAAFLTALAVRAMAGSATVAMLTAGGIIAPLLDNVQIEPALVVIAIASGATAISHVNDSGFWLVNRYFGLSTKETLKSWTVMESIIGITGATLAWLLSIF
jgi:Gnt-I system low-affinity gluconate transporter